MQEHIALFQEVTETSAGEFVFVGGEFLSKQQCDKAEDNWEHDGVDFDTAEDLRRAGTAFGESA